MVISIQEEYKQIMGTYKSSVTGNGQITLPKRWRDRHDVDSDDTVGLRETDDGTLEIVPPPQE